MATPAGQTWEDGRLVSRAQETNRWRVLPDGTEVGEDDEVEPKATRDYKAPTATKRSATTKAVDSDDTENKAVRSRSTSKK